MFRVWRKAVCVIFTLAMIGALNVQGQTGLGEVKNVKEIAGGIEFDLSNGARGRVVFVLPSVARVRVAFDGEFERDFSYAMEDKRRANVQVEIGGFEIDGTSSEARKRVANNSRVTTVAARGGTKVTISHAPFAITMQDETGATFLSSASRGAMYDADDKSFEMTFNRTSETETYYGFGEKAMPMSRHNQRMVNWNMDTFNYPVGLDPIYQTIPFYIALDKGKSYGLFFDNTFRSFFDTGKTDGRKLSFGAAGGELNFYIFTGGRERSPKQVLTDYTELTGRAPQPPRWALGYQQSRWSYYPEARVRKLAKDLRDNKIPCDVIYFDIDYMDGFRVFTWDKQSFPNPKKMLSDLQADGFHTVIIIDPGIKVDPKYKTYQEAIKGDYVVKEKDGEPLVRPVWAGASVFPDFTDAKAREWFASNYKQHLEEGVDGFWTDMNEPATFMPDDLEARGEPRLYHHPDKTFPLDTMHKGDGLADTHRRYHNVYGSLMAQATYEGLKKLRPADRPFVLTRAAYAGIQKYSAVWTGDNATSWDHLALTIPMLTNLGISGVPLVGADIGGFGGNPSPELYTRWLQAAALTPMMRSHVEKAYPDREPWMHGEPYLTINRKSIELRYQLIPHLEALFEEHRMTGAPVMRPLWFEYPTDAKTYLIEDEYLLGDSILVAPVVKEIAVKRRVYFPRGAAWFDWWTGVRYEGGTEVEVDAPLTKLPLFVREGARIKTHPLVQHTGEMRVENVRETVVDGKASFPLTQ